MSFTDDDLAYVRGCVNSKEPHSPIHGSSIARLIDRLEAAEALLERLWGNHGFTEKDLDKDHEVYLVWRKSAGRDK